MNSKMLFYDSLCDTSAIVTVILSYVIIYSAWNFTYWVRHHIPSAANEIWNPLTEGFGAWNKKIYNKFKAHGFKHGGAFVFTSPIYVPIDPEYIKNILNKNFHHFAERGIYYNEKDDPLSANLFNIDFIKWRNLRTKLTPTFTSGKMKTMFKTFVDCGKQMEEAMNTMHTKREPIDIKEVVACFTTDIIGSCAFGIECNSFKNPEAQFRQNGKQLFEKSALESLKIMFCFSQPTIARFLGLTFFPKTVTNFFKTVVSDTIAYRKDNNIRRNDFMQLLIDMYDNSTEQTHDTTQLTFNELAAQAFVFFLAGFETSSTTMTFCLYELAVNPKIQQKVADEIEIYLAKYDWKITYETMMEMKYMGQVIDETLRKYPPLPSLNRVCIEPYKIPNTDITLAKGNSVAISVLGLHHDPKLYPEPEKFDPDRFNEENKKNIKPYTYLPFGEGPRNCIGLRFGVLQTKVGLTMLLKNFEFTLNKNTRVPLKMIPSNFILSIEGGLWLNAKKRNK